MARFRITTRIDGVEDKFQEVGRIDAAKNAAQKEIKRIARVHGVNLQSICSEAVARAKTFKRGGFMNFPIKTSTVRLEEV